MVITPDTKNWTWVLERPCPECGFDAAATAFGDVPDLLRGSAEQWQGILAAPGAARRPDDATWSPLEYAAHVRDLCRVYRMRLNLMLATDGAGFADWDQDATAVAERYGEQDPAVVAAELAAQAEATAAAFAAVEPWQLSRRGLRSDGSAFTVDSLARYFLHDALHHLWDVRPR
ncbi:maleylpyruvate isomerase N-terminal domain-containing protein [Arthrobacter sp. Sa2BUA2]|uniref:Maleylpyruvate isomerase N-terminal domain-containing protein n=1 Tax=Arthrobacter pullicola TaxID=2762224 RepID=A0ABR8YHA4_9MICC|nr:DinB family protein [Arthrobacter pullicola]MBD8043594.1 maleylpyruvate isomerase N-terminal domain-containing protein [Arthrobacter pullicola]